MKITHPSEINQILKESRHATLDTMAWLRKHRLDPAKYHLLMGV